MTDDIEDETPEPKNDVPDEPDAPAPVDPDFPDDDAIDGEPATEEDA